MLIIHINKQLSLFQESVYKHHELVNVHRGVDGDLAPEIGLKFHFLDTCLGVILQQCRQALHHIMSLLEHALSLS